MREKYESLSLAVLKDLAKARGMKGISTLRKPALIERMLEEDAKESAKGNPEEVRRSTSGENNLKEKKQETEKTEYKRLMTRNEANILGKLMKNVVENGTASALNGRGYTVAGKTGSAEFDENGSSHSWFIGYSNVDNPDIAIAVIVENGGTGSEAAVPIAGDVFDAYYFD